MHGALGAPTACTNGACAGRAPGAPSASAEPGLHLAIWFKSDLLTAKEIQVQLQPLEKLVLQHFQAAFYPFASHFSLSCLVLAITSPFLLSLLPHANPFSPPAPQSLSFAVALCSFASHRSLAPDHPCCQLFHHHFPCKPLNSSASAQTAVSSSSSPRHWHWEGGHWDHRIDPLLCFHPAPSFPEEKQRQREACSSLANGWYRQLSLQRFSWAFVICILEPFSGS